MTLSSTSLFTKANNYQIDSFITHFEISPSDIPNITRYQALLQTANRTEAEETEFNNLQSVALRDKLILAEDMNYFQNILLNLETNFTEIYADFESSTQALMDKYSDKGFWSEATTYQKWNTISYDGQTFRSKQDGNLNHIPIGNVDDLWWTLTARKGDKGIGINLYPMGIYSNSTPYLVNHLVSYGGSLYYCITPTTGNAPSIPSSYWAVLQTNVAPVISNTVPTDLVDGLIWIDISTTDNVMKYYDGANTVWKVIGNTAGQISLSDSNGRFTATNVEDALQELAGEGRTTQTIKSVDDKIGVLNGSGEVVEKANKSDFTALKTDIEYQTPTLSGTQIQLIRQGTTKILKFYLSADLSGGNITISLDAGSTSVPLKDIDGIQLTSLNKGYVEVVDNTTFFTYAPKGGAVKIDGQTEVYATYHEDIAKNKLVTVRRHFGFDTPLKLDNPSSLLGSQGQGVDYSPDDKYLAFASYGSPYIHIYKRNGDTFTKLANPGTLPGGACNQIKFSPDGKYLCIGSNGVPYFLIYKIDSVNDTFTKLANPSSIPTAAIDDIAFKRDSSSVCIVGSNTSMIYNINSSTDTFTKDTTSGFPTSTAQGCAYSNDGLFLATTYTTGAYIKIYKYIAGTWTLQGNPTGSATGSGQSVAFSNDGKYLCMAHATSPYFTVWKKSGDTFTKIANADILPTGNSLYCAFSSDSKYLAIGNTATPYILIYKINNTNDTLTKIANPSTLPTSQGVGIAFANLNSYMTVTNESSPYITTYKADILGDYAYLYTGLSDLYVSNYLNVGYALNTDVANATNKKIITLPIK